MFVACHLFLGLILGLAIAKHLDDRRLIGFCALGAVLPDLIDKPLGHILLGGSLNSGRIFGHGLLFLALLLVAGIILMRRRQSFALLAVAAGTLSHQVLDAMWAIPVTWYFPLKYDEIDFNIPLRTEGDALARYFVRMEEMEQSIRIIRQCLDRVPDGPIRADNAKLAYPSKDEVYYSMEGMIHDFVMTDVGVSPPKGVESYHAIEAPKGELGFYLVSDGTGSPWRMKINSPSFCNLQGLEYMLEGAMVADTVVLIGSVDPVMGEADK